MGSDMVNEAIPAVKTNPNLGVQIIYLTHISVNVF